jgi:hypothetical protein
MIQEPEIALRAAGIKEFIMSDLYHGEYPVDMTPTEARVALTEIHAARPYVSPATDIRDHLEQFNLTGAQCEGVLNLIVPAVEALERICTEADCARLLLSPSTPYRDGLVEGLTRARHTAMPGIPVFNGGHP